MVERRATLGLLAHAVLILGVAIVALPIYITFVASTHTAEEIVQVPMPMLPGAHLIDNYTTALVGGGPGAGSHAAVGRMMFVSLVTALVITFGKIAISLLSAFAIVYFRFRFRMFFFWAIFVTLMLPVEVRILPTYKVVADLGMLNTFTGLTVPLIASATATFLFRQFFLTVPDELVEAARVDGAGPMRFFKDVLVPLSATIDRRALRHPVHLRLEPVPLAAAGDDAGEHVPGGDRHQADDRRRRLAEPVEPGHGDGDAGDDSAGAGGHPDAEVVRQGPGGH